MERTANAQTSALVILAVLGSMAALHFMKVILVPLALAMILACLLAPATRFLRRVLPLGATGAAVVLFLLMALIGLFVASLTAENLVEAARNLPGDAERFAGNLSRRVADLVRDYPMLRGILPDPGTIDLLGDRNRRLLIAGLSDRLADLSFWVAQGLITLILVVFLLAESDMLAPKVIRFFAPMPGDARAASKTMSDLTRQIRAYLVARSLINLGLGVAVAMVLWWKGVRFPIALGAFAALSNFVPYVGQAAGGALAVLVTLTQSDTIGDALIVASAYVALLGFEGYVVTPYVLAKSLDLNGTTVLIACLFWGFLWGLVGLILAMPITVCLKLVFQHSPSLQRWAELMSMDWQIPEPKKPPSLGDGEPLDLTSTKAPAA